MSKEFFTADMFDWLFPERYFPDEAGDSDGATIATEANARAKPLLQCLALAREALEFYNKHAGGVPLMRQKCDELYVDNGGKAHAALTAMDKVMGGEMKDDFKTNPQDSGSGGSVYYELTNTVNVTPFTCPVCGGNGLRPVGFYDQTSGTWATTAINVEQCRSCKGTGVVWTKF